MIHTAYTHGDGSGSARCGVTGFASNTSYASRGVKVRAKSIYVLDHSYSLFPAAYFVKSDGNTIHVQYSDFGDSGISRLIFACFATNISNASRVFQISADHSSPTAIADLPRRIFLSDDKTIHVQYSEDDGS